MVPQNSAYFPFFEDMQDNVEKFWCSSENSWENFNPLNFKYLVTAAKKIEAVFF